MLRDSDIASVAGCMLEHRSSWYDKQMDFLSDLDYRKGWAPVSGPTCWHVGLVDYGPGWCFECC